MTGLPPPWLDELRSTSEWREAHTAFDDTGRVVVPHFAWAGDHPPTFERFAAWLGETFGERVAVADYSGPRSGRSAAANEPRLVTYRELSGLVLRLAGWLAARGIGPWDHVSVCLPNSTEVLALQYAAACVGAVVSPVNLDQRDRVGQILRSADHKLVFVGADAAGFATEHGIPPARMIDVRAPEFRDDVERTRQLEPESAAPSVDDPVLILYTSGTTGSPKGAMLSPRGLFTGALALQEGFDLAGEDRFLLVNPLYHINSIAFGLALLGVGARIAIPPFAGHWEVAVREQITATSMVQRHLTPLLAPAGPVERRNTDRFDELHRGGTLKWIAVGSGPLAPDVQTRFLDRGVLILFRWGMSENHLAGTNVRPGHNLEDHRAHVGSTGPTNRYLNLFVVDEAGERRSTGRGRLVQRGAILVAYSTPDANVGAFEGGVHDTGDIAEITRQDDVYIIGRTKETILRSGENVFPRDVDDYLMRHPAVIFAQTVGFPDPDHSEEVGAFVVVTEGAPPERELIDYAAGLGIQKRPKRLVCVSPDQADGFLRFSGPGKPQRLANQILFWRIHFLDEASRLMARDGVLPPGSLGYGVPDGDGVGWLVIVPRDELVVQSALLAELLSYLIRASRLSESELSRVLAAERDCGRPAAEPPNRCGRERG